MKNKNKIIISFFALAIWMFIIFMFSAKPAFESGQQSGTLVKIIKECIKGVAPKANTTLIDWDFIETIIRKTAHFTVYLILGMLTLNSFFRIIKNKKKSVLLSFLFSCFYAVSDEIHQVFVPGRACRLYDVLIDSIGAFVGIIIFFVILKKCFRRCKF